MDRETIVIVTFLLVLAYVVANSIKPKEHIGANMPESTRVEASVN